MLVYDLGCDNLLCVWKWVMSSLSVRDSTQIHAHVCSTCGKASVSSGEFKKQMRGSTPIQHHKVVNFLVKLLNTANQYWYTDDYTLRRDLMSATLVEKIL